ncbi:hypothetical protein F7725_024090 [Dissostichus mawsoni]|uniref:Stromal cell-derived factor 1 n=1 Tax=Dissostichus mawsoni TaxID=36200 RepID=A0A7J5XZX1_DISMA|nr:hypothetical protein F7725_024090 [Dissostichus mawsoni]
MRLRADSWLLLANITEAAEEFLFPWPDSTRRRARDSLEDVEETRQRPSQQALSLPDPQWSRGRAPTGASCLYVLKPKYSGTVPSVTAPLDFTLSRIKSQWHYRRMDMKLLALLAALMVVIYAPPSQAKPISLVERCYCRSTVNSLPRGYIRELRFIHTPNCPFQVIAKLKSNKEVCVNPEIPWLQQYLKNAIKRMKKSRKGN